MSSKTSIVAGLVVACLIGGAGFYAGRLSVSRVPVPVNSQVGDDSMSVAEAPAVVAVSHPITTPSSSLSAAIQFHSASWEARWKEWAARPGSPRRDKELIAAIEELAASDPARALALLEKESPFQLRRDLLNATLRSWAVMHPDAATEWLFTQPASGREESAAAILNGAARNPAAAMQVASTLSQKDPAHARDYGAHLITALNVVGEFDRAAQFAANGPPEHRADWLTAAYSSWGRYQPERAIAAASGLQDPAARDAGVQAAYSAWAKTDPQGLAGRAIHARSVSLRGRSRQASRRSH